jgi:hypothetical protein
MKAWMVAAIGGPALFFGGGWYVGSPWITLYNLRNAVEHRDVETMIGYVDFVALRQNLKDQVRANAPPSTPRTDASGWSLPNPGGTDYAMVDRQIDRFINPDTARAMFFRADGGGTFDTRGRIDDLAEMASDIAIDRKGLGTFVVHGKNSPEGLGFVFTAHGLNWKLSGVSVPPGMAQTMGKRAISW